MTMRPARGFAQLQKPRTRSTLVALALIALMAAAGCGGKAQTASSRHQSPGAQSEPEPSSSPSESGPAKNEARLRRIATSTSMPLYYLGATYHGLPLTDVVVFTDGSEAVGDDTLDPGQTLSVGYGRYCSEGTCSARIEVDTQPATAVGVAAADGCSRLRPARGVPTVEFRASGTVFLFTGDLAITVGTTPPDDIKRAEIAATALRRVGADAPTDSPLPPPPPAMIPLIDKGCGRNPGDHGPDMFGQAGPLDSALPDFTIPRVGGGHLSWSDYAGKPVVVVAGDVTQVAPAVRRLAKLTSGGKSPAVIGLIWDPFGDKEHPPPITAIQRKAGTLPVPVGYPATDPAVWLNDLSGIDPNQSGVIGFLNRKGEPVTFLPANASDTKIREAIQQLH